MNPNKIIRRNKFTEKIESVYFKVFDSPVIWPEHFVEISKGKKKDGYFASAYTGSFYLGPTVEWVNRFCKSINPLYSDCNLNEEDFNIHGDEK